LYTQYNNLCNVVALRVRPAVDHFSSIAVRVCPPIQIVSSPAARGEAPCGSSLADRMCAERQTLPYWVAMAGPETPCAVVGATLWLPLHASPAPCWLIKGYHGCIGTVQYHDTRKDEDCAPRATPQPTPIMTADMWRATKNTRRGCPSLVHPIVVPISACSVSHRCHHRTNICAHPVPSYAACETVEISSRPFEASHCQALLRGRPYRLGACFLFSRQSQSTWLMSS
jgi:hypothetical protein